MIAAYRLSCMINDFQGKAGGKDVVVKGFIDTDNRLFIKLDGKQCWPSTLCSYLMTDTGNREYLGVFKPKA